VALVERAFPTPSPERQSPTAAAVAVVAQLLAHQAALVVAAQVDPTAPDPMAHPTLEAVAAVLVATPAAAVPAS